MDVESNAPAPAGDPATGGSATATTPVARLPYGVSTVPAKVTLSTADIVAAVAAALIVWGPLLGGAFHTR